MPLSYRTIALVDLSCLFKRIYESGDKGNAAHRTLAELTRIRSRVEHMVVCLDAPPYSRTQLFADYKAQREAPEPGEVYQKRWLLDRCKAVGFQLARHKGSEADDVIATLARIYGEHCPEVWLVGADKDLAQCVTDNVLQLVPQHGERAEHFRGPVQVKEKYEVMPAQIPLYLALVGDRSDNIPGVPGIGQVKAAGLIAEHKTLEGIAGALATGSGKMWDSLRQNWEKLVLSLKLTTLDTKLPLDADALLERLAPQPETESMDGDGTMELMGNETPMPEQNPPPTPQPIIGKDPRADEFLRQQHAERNADRAAREAQEKELAKEQEQQPRRERVADAVQAAYRGKRDAALAGADFVMNPGTLPRPPIAAVPPPPAVTEAEFDPISRPPAAEPPPPPPAAAAPEPPPVPKGPGLVKAEPRDYGLVTDDLQPKDLRSAEVISKWLHAGNLYPAFTSPQAIFSVIARGKEMGIGMTTALAGFHVVEGKPTASADLIRALAVRSKKCKYLRLVHSDTKSATWETWHADHPEPTQYTYTIDEAEAAGLTRPGRSGKPSNWVTRPRDLLTKTAGSKLCRIVFPEETLGLYCPEEMDSSIDTVGEEAA